MTLLFFYRFKEKLYITAVLMFMRTERKPPPLPLGGSTTILQCGNPV